MDLTSLRRVKYTLNITKADEDPILAALVGSASKEIVWWLRRLDQSGEDGIELKSRVEYVDPTPGERTFWPLCYPIQSVTSVYTDGYGRYAGSEQLVDATWYYLGGELRTLAFVTVPRLPDWTGFPCVPRGMRLTYTAGLAVDPVLSVWTKTGGTLTAGYFVRGETTGSIGRVSTTASGSLTIECLGGNFQAETVTEYKRLDGSAMDGGVLDASGQSCVLTACSSRCLAEAHPTLTMAAEMHVAFLRKNRDDFGNLTVSQDGATRFSRSDLKNTYEFMPEIRSLLAPYKNNLVRP